MLILEDRLPSVVQHNASGTQSDDERANLLSLSPSSPATIQLSVQPNLHQTAPNPSGTVCPRLLDGTAFTRLSHPMLSPKPGGHVHPFALHRQDSKLIPLNHVWATPDSEKTLAGEAADDLEQPKLFDFASATLTEGNFAEIGDESPLDSMDSKDDPDEYHPRRNRAPRSKRKRTAKSVSFSPASTSDLSPRRQRKSGSHTSDAADHISIRMIKSASLEIFGCSMEQITEEQKELCAQSILRKRTKNMEAARASRVRKKQVFVDLEVKVKGTVARNII